MAYKQNPGRGPMMKTGCGVPSALLQTDPKDPVKNKKEKTITSSSRELSRGTGPSATGESVTGTWDVTSASTRSIAYKKPKRTAEGDAAYKSMTPKQRKAADTKYIKKNKASGTAKSSQMRKFNPDPVVKTPKTASVKSSFGEDKIFQKTFKAPKLSRLDKLRIKKFDTDIKREETLELKAEIRDARINKLKETRSKRKPMSTGQLEAQAKRNKKNKRARKRAKFWGNISSALTPSGKSGFKPGCFTD